MIDNFALKADLCTQWAVLDCTDSKCGGRSPDWLATVCTSQNGSHQRNSFRLLRRKNGKTVKCVTKVHNCELSVTSFRRRKRRNTNWNDYSKTRHTGEYSDVSGNVEKKKLRVPTVTIHLCRNTLRTWATEMQTFKSVQPIIIMWKSEPLTGSLYNYNNNLSTDHC